jgi:acyl-CoA thioester hydrolase
MSVLVATPMTSFRFSIPIEVRFRDVDALGHVNNAVHFTYMEHARIAYLRRLGLFSGDPSDTGMIVAEAACVYKAPIVFGQTIVVRMRATNLKNSSFVFEYSLEDDGSGQVMATGRSVQVCYDYTAGRSTPIPAVWRERIQAFERGE